MEGAHLNLVTWISRRELPGDLLLQHLAHQSAINRTTYFCHHESHERPEGPHPFFLYKLLPARNDRMDKLFEVITGNCGRTFSDSVRVR